MQNLAFIQRCVFKDACFILLSSPLDLFLPPCHRMGKDGPKTVLVNSLPLKRPVEFEGKFLGLEENFLGENQFNLVWDE